MMPAIEIDPTLISPTTATPTVTAEPVVPPEPTATPESGDEVEYDGLAIWPLIYILILPAAVIGVLQWSGLPGWVMRAVTGN